MQACNDCSSAMSYVFDAVLQLPKTPNISGQKHPRRTMLEISRNAKSCDFCNFIASEIRTFAQKKDLDIKESQTVAMFGNWKDYRFEADESNSRILESICFQVFQLSNNISDYWEGMCAVEAYPICIESDDALSKYVLTRLPDADPLSDRSLSKIHSWIDDCNAYHSDCARIDSSMPTRIIDISQYNQLGTVKLVDSKGQNGHYVALSHCWGTSKSFTTTAKTLEERKREIIVQDLPKTFQDAIHITDILHLQYIWIDSICILQDDPDDWEEEASQMSRVYSNSYITIAATRAKDDLEGFLGMRPEYLQVNIDFSLGSSTIYVFPVQHSIYSEIDTGKLNDMPLNTRAWTLQERYLSRRLLHFSQDQTYWECSFLAGERGVAVKRVSNLDGLLDGLLDKEHGCRRSSTTPPWIDAWSTLVERYSKRKLTIDRDRLPALAGLARQVAERTGDRYCAGLWQSSFAYGLCWAGYFKHSEAPAKYEPERFLGPSWSWVSVNAPVGYFSVTAGDTICAEFLSCELEIQGQNPYGVVNGGRLKVKAPLIEIYPVAGRGGFPFWDRGITYPCFALRLWDGPSYYMAVAVKPTLRVDGEYWKVGCIPRAEYTPYSEEDVKIITLV